MVECTAVGRKNCCRVHTCIFERTLLSFRAVQPLRHAISQFVSVGRLACCIKMKIGTSGGRHCVVHNTAGGGQRVHVGMGVCSCKCQEHGKVVCHLLCMPPCACMMA